jgi:hypothetical protein
MLKKMSRILHPVAGFQEKRAVKAVQQMPSLHQTLGTEVLLYSQRIVYCLIVPSRNCSRVLVVSVAVMPFGTAKTSIMQEFVLKFRTVEVETATA